MQAFFYIFLFLFSLFISPLFCAKKIIQFLQASVNFAKPAVPLGIVIAPAPERICTAPFSASHALIHALSLLLLLII